MTDIMRYAFTNDKGVINTVDGEYIEFEDYEKRVESQLKLLEVAGRRIGQLEEDLRVMTELSKKQCEHIERLHAEFEKLNNLTENL